MKWGKLLRGSRFSQFEIKKEHSKENIFSWTPISHYFSALLPENKLFFRRYNGIIASEHSSA